MDDNYEFYCLSFNNKERKESMVSRFDKIEIKCNIYELNLFSKYFQINMSYCDHVFFQLPLKRYHKDCF